jgi:sugar phosphate isomerase/epimerase
MFTLSAFADEISPDPQVQVDVLAACGVRHIEFRSIHGTNVLALDDARIGEFKSLLERHGFRLSAIGSPVGKVRVDEPFEPHWQKFERAIHLCRVFGTPNIRIFSYYPREGTTWDDAPAADRDEVFARLERQIRRAEEAGVRLFHENEHNIFGDSPARLRELFSRLASPAFQAAFDPANFVFCGYDPWEGWLASRDCLAHFHVKDWSAGEKHGRIPGEGQGRIPEIIADAVARGYDGYATMEPHLMGGGPTGGVTGPDLFPKAVAAFRDILQRVGAAVA